MLLHSNIAGNGIEALVRCAGYQLNRKNACTAVSDTAWIFGYRSTSVAKAPSITVDTSGANRTGINEIESITAQALVTVPGKSGFGLRKHLHVLPGSIVATQVAAHNQPHTISTRVVV